MKNHEILQISDIFENRKFLKLQPLELCKLLKFFKELYIYLIFKVLRLLFIKFLKSYPFSHITAHLDLSCHFQSAKAYPGRTFLDQVLLNNVILELNKISLPSPNLPRFMAEDTELHFFPSLWLSPLYSKWIGVKYLYILVHKAVRLNLQ
jgi:hypothetical protein